MSLNKVFYYSTQTDTHTIDIDRYTLASHWIIYKQIARVMLMYICILVESGAMAQQQYRKSKGCENVNCLFDYSHCWCKLSAMWRFSFFFYSVLRLAPENLFCYWQQYSLHICKLHR